MHRTVLILCAYNCAFRHAKRSISAVLSLSSCASMPDLPLSHSDRPTTQVTVVCLVALASGKMHCLLDAKHCKETAEGGAAQALLPPAGARPGALAHRALSSNPTIRVSCEMMAHMAINQLESRLSVLVLCSYCAHSLCCEQPKRQEQLSGSSWPGRHAVMTVAALGAAGEVRSAGAGHPACCLPVYDTRHCRARAYVEGMVQVS